MNLRYIPSYCKANCVPVFKALLTQSREPSQRGKNMKYIQACTLVKCCTYRAYTVTNFVKGLLKSQGVSLSVADLHGLHRKITPWPASSMMFPRTPCFILYSLLYLRVCTYTSLVNIQCLFQPQPLNKINRIWNNIL